MKEYQKDTREVLADLASDPDGLSSDEAGRRLERDGANELKAPPRKSLFRRFLAQLADPMIIILLAAALVSGVLAVFSGEGLADVFIILTVVILNAILGVFQESKAEKAIEALREMSAATAKVMRDGAAVRMESAKIVVGDVVLLEAGDAVPADGRILECASLKAEESALTGESVPVLKTAEVIDRDGTIPLGDRKNMLYMGSTVVYGRAKMVVTDTGMKTEMGKIAGALSDAVEEKTPLQKKLSELSKVLTWLVLGICAVVFAVQIIRAGGFEFERILDAFMVAVSLAVAAIPEGLAAVVTVVLSIGVTNMAKRNAIIRKLTAVETLGCAQIICSDKTGTLTQNKMTVTDVYASDRDLTATAFSLCTDAKLAPGETRSVGDPTQTAVVDYAAEIGLPKYSLEESYPRVAEIPFDSDRKLMTTFHKSKGGIVQYTTGAPDVVIGRCKTILRDEVEIPLTDEIRAELVAANKSFADKALRVLAAARKSGETLPGAVGPECENDLCFLGLVGMIDPIRPEVADAIAECRSAGITPVMITGDHIFTAAAIARQLGILTDDTRAVTGAELDRMDDETFARECPAIRVYARVQPEHKTRIVRAWQSAGYVTAMTGDGVNDAPSIKAADIGVGMGITGTDVTKNVADMVLSDDHFATIVGAVEEGRRIYDNIRRAIRFLLGSNMSEVMGIFFASLAGFTLLKPVHLLWINLLTDTFPALALGTEKAEGDLMRRRPRDPRDGIFSGGMGVDILYQGLMVTLLVLASFLIGHKLETGTWGFHTCAHGMTMAFLTMSFAETFHSFNMRSERGSVFTIPTVNPLLILSAFFSAAATTAVCEIPFLARLFGFTSVGIREYLIAAGLGILVIPIVETVKFFQRKFRVKKAKTV